ncbi:hypothetical protein Y032_0002g655 [Ancylostoma ceylanicum]|uniref:40S ribosomal protein S27 n=1 Tax=Ancylostoma ceylanicum TaxID=53326 RepID=A0A016W0L4_9BILA|nr:hypothetical protein Y032_0002g655 [Ancylostoma ceylanicum]
MDFHRSQFSAKPARLGRIMPLAIDLLHPDPETERQRHKLKRLVQHPNSYFMDVKCPGCFKVGHQVSDLMHSSNCM